MGFVDFIIALCVGYGVQYGAYWFYLLFWSRFWVCLLLLFTMVYLSLLVWGVTDIDSALDTTVRLSF